MDNLPRTSVDSRSQQDSIHSRSFHPTGNFVRFEKEEIEQSIPTRFEQQVSKYPHRLAVKTSSHEFTYEELNSAANRVARAILAQRGEGEEPLALLLEYGAFVPVGIIAALKAGKIYVPLDPAYPRARNEYMLADSQANLIVTDSQNLRLAACAARYEQKTGRPIQYVLARVADPTPGGCCFKDLTDVRVHVVAPSDRTVQHLVYGLLKQKAVLWKRSGPEKLAGWYDWQARVHANGIVESQALGKHPWSAVSHVRLDDFELVATEGLSRHYRFHGKAWSSNVAIPFRKRWTHVRGTVALTYDPFGRVLAAQADVQERRDG